MESTAEPIASPSLELTEQCVKCVAASPQPEPKRVVGIPFDRDKARQAGIKSAQRRAWLKANPQPAEPHLEPNASVTQDKGLNALGLIQTHGKEQLVTNMLPDQTKRVAELNAQLDGINRLIDKSTAGQLVVGYDEDSGLVFASPRDIQALSKARRDILEMLFRIHGVSREPIAKTPTGNTKRRSMSITPE